MENSRFLPFFLILLLDRDQGISFLGLGSARQLFSVIFTQELGHSTFSSFSVFLELLFGSNASLVPLTAAMAAVPGMSLLDMCMGLPSNSVVATTALYQVLFSRGEVCLVRLLNPS